MTANILMVLSMGRGKLWPFCFGQIITGAKSTFFRTLGTPTEPQRDNLVGSIFFVQFWGCIIVGQGIIIARSDTGIRW